MNEPTTTSGKPRNAIDFFQCIGLAALMLLVNYIDLLNGGTNVRIHTPYPLTMVGLAVTADILGLGLLFFVVRRLLARTRFYPWARLLIILFAPPYLIERTKPLIPLDLKDGVIAAAAVLWVALVLLMLLQFPRVYRIIVRVGDAIGIFAAVFGLCSIAQILIVMAWRPGPQQIVASWSRSPQPPRVHPRVVWIVFDELSYDQLFEHRAHDLDVPNFDRLRAQSTLYTDAQPVGYKTVKVIPSLFTGRIIDDFQYQFNNRFIVHYADTDKWRALNGDGTIFADAHRAGWRTAIVGWYNPYCTIYGSALDNCYWSYLDAIGMDTAQGQQFAGNAWRPLQEIGVQIYSPEAEDKLTCNFEVQRRIQTHLDLQRHAAELLQQDQDDLVFLHLSIPHPPAIWSRLDAAYVDECGSSYIDNLALADRQLGKIMTILEQSPRWKDTTVIVEGDHSWRVALWNWLPGWTDEDDRASGDKFDTRPALLIHNAGQTQPQTVAQPTSLMLVHQTLENIVHNPQQTPSAAPH